MSCCPAGSWPALQAPTDYKRQGKVGVIHGDIQAYTVGSTAGAKRAILVLTDIFGIDSGRVQAVTDQLAKEHDALCVLVDIMPGDAFPDALLADPNFMTHCGAWLRKYPFEVLRDKFLLSTVAYIKAQGAENIGIIGFCYGAWVSFHIGADPAFAGVFKCAVDCHPSVNVEEMLYNRSSADLAKKQNFPHLLLAAANEQVWLKEGGAVIEELKKLPFGASCQVVDFPDSQHGWVIRGDLTVPTVARDVEKALRLSHDYFKANL